MEHECKINADFDVQLKNGPSPWIDVLLFIHLQQQNQKKAS